MHTHYKLMGISRFLLVWWPKSVSVYCIICMCVRARMFVFVCARWVTAEVTAQDLKHQQQNDNSNFMDVWSDTDTHTQTYIMFADHEASPEVKNDSENSNKWNMKKYQLRINQIFRNSLRWKSHSESSFDTSVS